ncbi:hypothetical protein LSAT2_028804 [Lamellibrachia satsuma]|nr:hypothetical protein LSAT2_028804 [Lamellibrachia satsuma]
MAQKRTMKRTQKRTRKRTEHDTEEDTSQLMQCDHHSRERAHDGDVLTQQTLSFQNGMQSKVVVTAASERMVLTS